MMPPKNFTSQNLLRYLSEISDIFSSSISRREAHLHAAPIILLMTKDVNVLRDVIRANLEIPEFLNRGNYPCPSMQIIRTPHFEFVANCWISLPNGASDISTKSLHHHGEMLLTTGTAFGPGYEHWQLEICDRVNEEEALYKMKLIESAVHGLNNVSFVDRQVVHVPLYPESLTITYALWSKAQSTSLFDRVKATSFVSKYRNGIKKVLRQAGMNKALNSRYPEYLDFYPVEGGFKGIRHRSEVEFQLGPVVDHLQSIFHVIQKTGYEDMIDSIQTAISTRNTLAADDKRYALQLLDKLREGVPIEGKLTEKLHFGFPRANFTRRQIQESLLM